MTTGGRRPVVRARQRSRTSLLAFADPLHPTFEETGIDQLRVGVKGSWTALAGPSGPDDYRAVLVSNAAALGWFNSPNRSHNRTILETALRTNATIGLHLKAFDRGPHRLDLTFSYRCNPTNTLSHLLHRYREAQCSEAEIVALSATDFFTATHGVPLSFDDHTNWVADLDLARSVFGPDIFSAFLPIYVDQLRALSRHLASFDSANETHGEDNQADVLAGPEAQIRLEWGGVAAPQCETYFERFHAGARPAVRAVAQNTLAKVDQSTVRHHLFHPAFRRQFDLFSIRCDLPQKRELSIYAKVMDRPRFEISRKGPGRYPVLAQRGASGRLLAILASERMYLTTACQWRVVGELLVEHDAPVAEDLLSLIMTVVASCEATGADLRSVLTSLLLDAGITATAQNAELISVLRDAGIIERTTLRRRDGRLPRRFSLRDPYLAVFEAVLDAVSEGTNRI